MIFDFPQKQKLLDLQEKDEDILLLKSKINMIDKEKKMMESKIFDLEDQLSQESLKRKIELKKMAEMDKELKELRREIKLSGSKKIEKKEQREPFKLNQLQRKLMDSESLIEQLEHRIESLQKSLQVRLEKLEFTEKELEQSQTEKNELNVKLHTIESKLREQIREEELDSQMQMKERLNKIEIEHRDEFEKLSNQHKEKLKEQSTTFLNKLDSTESELRRERINFQREMREQKESFEKEFRMMDLKLENEMKLRDQFERQNRRLLARNEKLENELKTSNNKRIEKTYSSKVNLEYLLQSGPVSSVKEFELKHLQEENLKLKQSKEKISEKNKKKVLLLKKLKELNDTLLFKNKKLEEKLENYRQDISKLNQKFESEFKNRINLENQLSSESKQLKSLESQLSGYKELNHKQYKEYEEESSRSRESYNKNIESIQLRFDIQKEKWSNEKKNLIEKYESKIGELEIKYEKREDRIEKIERDLKMKNQEMFELKIQLEEEKDSCLLLDDMRLRLEEELMQIGMKYKLAIINKNDLQKSFEGVSSNEEKLKKLLLEKEELNEKYSEIENSYNSLKRNHTKIVKEKEQLEIECKTLDKSLKSVREQLLGSLNQQSSKEKLTTKKYDALQEQHNRVQDDYIKMEQELNELKRRLKNFQLNGSFSSSLNNDYKELKYKLDDARLEKRKFEELNIELQNEIRILKKKLEDTLLEKLQLEANCHRLNQDLEEIGNLNSTSELTNRIIEETRNRRMNEGKIENLSNEIQNLKKELILKEQQISEKNIQQNLEKVEKEKMQIQKSLNNAEEALSLERKEKMKAQEKAKDLESEMKHLVLTEQLSIIDHNTSQENLIGQVKKLSVCLEYEKKQSVKSVNAKYKLKDKVNSLKNENSYLQERLEMLQKKLIEAQLKSESLQNQLEKNTSENNIQRESYFEKKKQEALESENRINEAKKQQKENKEKLRKKISSAITGRPMKSNDNFKIDPRLIILTGKKKVIPFVVELDTGELSTKDVFILETAEIIYQYNGAITTKEKIEAANILVDEIVSKRPPEFKPEKIIFEDGIVTEENFWKELGGEDEIEEGIDDDFFQHKKQQKYHYYSCELLDNNIELLAESLSDGTELKSTLTYILNCDTEVYLWCGKETGVNYRRRSEFEADKLKRYDWVKVERVLEGFEHTLFTSKFKEWKRIKEEQIEQPKKEEHSSIEIQEPNKETKKQTTVEELIEWKPTIDEEYYDSYGKIKMWLVSEKNYTTKLLSEELHGSFYRGSCYFVLFTPFGVTEAKEKKAWFWQGSESKLDQQMVSKTIEKLLNENENPPFLKVKEGFEPAQLFSLFSGSFIVHFGFHESIEHPLVSLYEVRGNKECDTVTIQCSAIAKNLNSHSVFILHTPKSNFIWQGDLSNDFTKQTADNLCLNILKSDKTITIRMEG